MLFKKNFSQRCRTIKSQLAVRESTGKCLSFYLAFFIILIMSLFHISCDIDEGEVGNLNGVWINLYHDPSGEYDDFETIITINTANKTVVYKGSYEAKISNSPDFSSAGGVLIIQFTKYADWGEEPSTEHDNVNKFGALYWRDLKHNSVRLADAYIGWDHAIFDTSEEAQEKFTIDKIGDYIDWSIVGLYTK